ncbi:hypothetical protein BN871_BW_00170 [Paenibacillus sp. P22]|nr:hypothetical protein BN871_BW_00170 [Paenibacillus sp. P22]
MVGDPFDIAADKAEQHRLVDRTGILDHDREHLPDDLRIEGIDDVVVLRHLVGQIHILLHVGLDGFENHRLHGLRHARQVDQRLDQLLAVQSHDDLGDVDGQIAHTLQVSRDPERHENAAQVLGDRLLRRDQLGAELGDLLLQAVQLRILLDDLSRFLGIDMDEGMHGFGQRRFDMVSHFDQHGLQLIQSFVKLLAFDHVLSLPLPASALTESPCNIVFRPRIRRIGEQLLRLFRFHELSIEEEYRAVGNPGRLMHVVRHHDDRILFLELADELLDLERRDRVQSGRSLVHEQHLRLHGQSARDAQPLLLSAREAQRGLAEQILHFLPQRGAAQAALDDIVQAGFVPDAMQARTIGDIVEDRLGKRIGLLEHHADTLAEHFHVGVRAVDILSVQLDAAADLNAGHEVVHPVQRAEEGGFAAAGRSDEGRHGFFGNAEIDLLQGVKVSIMQIKTVDLHYLVHSVPCSHSSWNLSRSGPRCNRRSACFPDS